MVIDKLMICELQLTLSSANRLSSPKVLGSSSLHFWQIAFLLFLVKKKEKLNTNPLLPCSLGGLCIGTDTNKPMKIVISTQNP